ncbi:arf-GAP with SH3 domain, ANK repeat and PH domain-containing protein 2 isoform X9 [Mus musculus]|nr:arf-GAP with SH3 domain, ANK repeat and PH domain-containing protein 2 isoform X9 [Mus musculus]
MPEQISVSEFVAETHEGYKAPKAFSFTTRTAQCRDTVAAIEEAWSSSLSSLCIIPQWF